MAHFFMGITGNPASRTGMTEYAVYGSSHIQILSLNRKLSLTKPMKTDQNWHSSQQPKQKYSVLAILCLMGVFLSFLYM